MRRFRWFLGLMMIFGVVASPLLTVWAEDGTPVVVDDPIATAPDTPETIVTEPDLPEPTAPDETEPPAPSQTEPPVPTVSASTVPESTATEGNDFSAAVAPVLSVGGSTTSPASFPFGAQTTVAVSGLGQTMQVFFYTAVAGCPRDVPGRVLIFNDTTTNSGTLSFSRTGSPGTTEYLQAQLYGGEWSNCIQVNWIGPPPATNTAPAAPVLLAGTYLGTLTEDTQISLAASDWFQYQAQNIPALLFFIGAGCDPANYGYALTLPSGVINPAGLPQENQLIDNAFSIQGYSGSIDAGGQPVTTCRTITVSGLPTATATSAETPVPSLAINNDGTSTFLQLNLGDWVDVIPVNIPVLVWFSGGGCQPANFRTETVSPVPASSNTNGYASTWFIDNQFSLQGYSGNFNTGGQPITTCRTIEVLGRPAATATETIAPTATATATIDPSATPSSILTVNGETGTVSAQNGYSIHVVVSGIPPEGVSVLYWSASGCPDTGPADLDLTGLPAPDGNGVTSANRGGFFDTTLYYQANGGQWSNCVRVDWSAPATTATATATFAQPVLTVNGGSGPVSVTNGQPVAVVISGITPGATISLYWNATGCPSSSDPGGTDGTALKDSDWDGAVSSNRNGLANATLYYQATDSTRGWSTCVRVDWSAPPTATSTATTEPTETPTITPTPGPEILINGEPNALTVVQPGDLVEVTTVNVVYAQIYADGNCAMAVPPSIPGDATTTKTAAEWQAQAVGSFLFSFRGFDETNQAVTPCLAVSVDFTPVANVVLDIDGSTETIIQRTGGTGVTATVRGVVPNTAFSLFTSLYSCPYQGPDATAQYDLTADGNGTASTAIPGESDATRYIQVQLADGSWTSCIQVVWSAAPTATIPTGPGPMIFTVNGYTSGTLTVDPDDVITVHVENVSALIVYGQATCGGAPVYDYGVMLNNNIVDAASNWTHTPSFSMQAHGMDSSTGNCITIAITQPTATATTAPTPNLLVNGDTATFVQVNLGERFSLHLEGFPTLVWFHGGGCDIANVWYDTAVGYPDLSYNTSGFDPSTFINNQISIQGYSGSVAASGQPVTTCRTIEVLGLPTATATETVLPTLTPTNTATTTQQVLVMTVDGSTDSPVHVDAGAMVSMTTSGLVPGGEVRYGYSQAGCPSAVSSPGMQGPYPVDGTGSHLFQAGGIAGVTWYYQAQQNGIWSNCIAIVWAAEATATPVPMLLINDSTNTVTHVDYFNGSIAVDWSGIPLLNLYPNTDCSGTASLYYSGGAGSRTYSAMSWATTVGGYVFSLRGYTSPNPTELTDCRTVIIDNAPVTATATAASTNTALATTTRTATATDTVEPTATATTIPGALLTVNGFPDDVVHVWVDGTVTIVWQNIPYVASYRSANCTGATSPIGSNSGANSNSGTNWQTWAGAPFFSIRGLAESYSGGPAMTTCRTIYLDRDPPTATPAPLLTINGSTADLQHVALSSQVFIVATGIRYVSFYFGTGCTGTNYFNGTDLNGTGQFYSIPASNPGWPQNGGFSVQGFTSAGGTALTTCRSVVIDMPAATATTAPTATSTATTAPTEMMQPPVMTADGSTETPHNVPANQPVDLMFSGLDPNDLFSYYWSLSGCPQEGDMAGQYGPLYPHQDGTFGIQTSGNVAVIWYMQAQAADGQWSNCIAIVWAALPAATETPMPTDTVVPTSTVTKTIVATVTETAVATSTATEDQPPATATSTVAPTVTSTTIPTTTATSEPSATTVPTGTATVIPTNTITNTPTATASIAPTDTVVLTNTATVIPSNTPTETAVPTRTVPATSTFIPTATSTFGPTATEIATTVPTMTMTVVPMGTATTVPTQTATTESTSTATEQPTETATTVPTQIATATEVPPSTTPTETVPVGTVRIQLTTSDGGDIPAGTTWLLSEGSAIGSPSGTGRFLAAQIAGAQGGTLETALPSGGLLPVANPIRFGTYTLTIDAPGYEMLVEPIDVSEATTLVTVEVRLIAGPAATVTVTTTNAPRSTATVVPTGIPAVSDLPKTGSGNDVSPPWPLLLLTIAGVFAIGGAVIGGRIRRR